MRWKYGEITTTDGKKYILTYEDISECGFDTKYIEVE